MVIPFTLQSATDRIDQQRIAFLDWLLAEAKARQDRYVAYREYYDGEHDTQLTDRQRRYLQLKVGEEFNDNYCSIVVDALAERLQVTGFDAGDVGAVLWEWWQANRMDRLQGQVHTATVRDGDGYVVVEWDNDAGIPRPTMELACDGSDGVKVHYDQETREISFASKRWLARSGPDAGSVRRMNLYYPDRIEKYVSRSEHEAGIWMRYDEEGQPWPIPWVDGAGDGLGVPVVHFKNQDTGYDYGVSELRDVVPLQNALNKAIIDLLAVADTAAFPIPYVIGDNPGNIDLSVGQWIYSQKPRTEVEIGRLEVANLERIIELKDSFVMEIARVSRTPLSYFQISGQRAAEGTLKQEEQPLVSKAEKRQVSFGDSWAEVMRMGARLHNAFGSGAELDEEQIIETMWDSPATRDEKALLESLKLKAELGVPTERLWAEMGYDQDTIAEMRAMRGEEMQAASNIGGELLRAFERGE